jgi:hypothetical protein
MAALRGATPAHGVTEFTAFVTRHRPRSGTMPVHVSCRPGIASAAVASSNVQPA